MSMPDITERLYTSVLPESFRKKFEAFSSRISNDQLIRWDLRTFAFVIGCLLAYAFMVSQNYSGSSTEKWNQYIIDSTKLAETQPVYGTAKWIRFDEWCLGTPCIRSQAIKNFPAQNPALGYGESPILMGVPVHDITSYIKPSLWGFFIFSFERAYSFFWYYKTIGILIGAFLVLKILTKNNFWLSIGGAFWLLYSSYVQWWFSTPGSDLMVSALMMIVFGLYLLMSRSTLTIIISSLALSVFSTAFVLTLYPPYQVSLGYLVLFVMGAHLWSNYSAELFRDKLAIRAGGFVLMLAIIGLILMHFLNTCKDSIAVMSQTLYPGNRISTGGVISMTKYFAGIFDYTFSETRLPQGMWGNPCEASNFILIWPLVIMGMLLDRYRSGRFDRTQIVILAYILLVSGWIVVGYPDFIAKLTALNRVRENRALIGIGMANIFLAVQFISRSISNVRSESAVVTDDNSKKRRKASKENQKVKNVSLSNFSTPVIVTACAAFVIAFIWIYFLGQAFNEVSKNFLSANQIKLTAIAAGALSFMLITRLRLAFIGILVGAVLWSNFAINPIAKGMTAMTNKDLMHAIEDIRVKDPTAKWMCYGSNVLANYLIAAGVDVLAGTKFIPDLPMYKTLDPDGKNAEAYNRFAHVHVLPNYTAKNIDDMFWRKDGDDAFTWLVNPSASGLEKVGVKYWLSNRLIRFSEYNKVEPIVDSTVNGLYLYRRKTQDSMDATAKLAKLSEIKGEDRIKIAEYKGSGDEQRGMFIIEGWSFDLQRRAVPANIYIRVNNHLVKGVVGLDSPSPLAPSKKCGFRIEVPYTRIGSGTVGMEIISVSADGSSYRQSPTIAVNMN